MKPHMAHIQNTLIKKKLAEDAKNTTTSYSRYRTKVDRALQAGYSKADIVTELESEINFIMTDTRDSNDPLFQQGVHNAKVACISSIRTIIAELKGEDNAFIRSQS